MLRESSHHLLFSSGDIGDTELHALARHCLDPKEIEDFILKHGEEHAAKMAKTINKRGDLPLDIIQRRRLSADLKNTLAAKIGGLTVQQVIWPLKYEVDVSKTISEYHLTAKDLLYQNLMVAAEIANYARTIILGSSTHPESNLYETDIYNEVDELIDIMRNESDQAAKRYHMDVLTKLYYAVQLIQEYRVGNCGEFCYIVATKLQQSYKMGSEIYSIINGDHCFVVLGRDPYSNPVDYRTWGKNAIVCDAWSGEVYPAEEIAQRLGNYINIRVNYSYHSIVTTFNPFFHQLKMAYSCPSVPGEDKASSLSETPVLRRSSAI
jgi:hypothetical protein